MFSKYLVALLALSPLAFAGNFMLLTSEGACNYGACDNTLGITQNSVQPPTCTQYESARAAALESDWNNKKNFSGTACGVKLNFYWDGSQYNYYQNGGSGSSLGWCEPEEMTSHWCTLADGGYEVRGVAWCQNYDQTKNGINPCV